MTSSGVVKPAAKAPAKAPDTQWVTGSYPLPGLMTFDNDSYAVN